MNMRALIAALYMIMFGVALLNMATFPSTLFADVAPTLFTSVIMALAGALLSLWVYQDGENINLLGKEVVRLAAKLKELEKK